jgi:hypothetical protein
VLNDTVAFEAISNVDAPEALDSNLCLSSHPIGVIPSHVAFKHRLTAPEALYWPPFLSAVNGNAETIRIIRIVKSNPCNSPRRRSLSFPKLSNLEPLPWKDAINALMHPIDHCANIVSRCG